MNLKNLPLTTLIFVGVMLASAGIFWWLYRAVDNATVELANVRTNLKTLEDDREAARQISAVLENNEIAVERMQKFPVNAQKPLEFIETLEDLARSTGSTAALDLDSQKKSKTDELTLRVTVEGTRSGILTYIKLLELLPHIIHIDEINYQTVTDSRPAANSGAHGTGGNRLLITLSVKTQ